MERRIRMELPENILRLTEEEAYTVNRTGMSGAAVRLYRDRVMKIQPWGPETENEIAMLKYLQGKLPVPKICAQEAEGGMSYLLMTRCEGRMACDPAYLADPAALSALLAAGLRGLWSVDVSGCPCDQRLERKLEAARYNVENGLVDLNNVEPGTFGKNGFRDPAALLKWLYANRPEEEPVLSHGDFCLPNLFGREDQVTGYIDLGRAGTADKWCDIALCWRSLHHNYAGKYSGTSAGEPDVMLLFRALGLEPDWKKIRYYILLDELF